MKEQEQKELAILHCQTGDETTAAIKDALVRRQELLLCGTVDKTMVTYGSDGIVFNRQYCADNNITVVKSPVAVAGGTVIFSRGDMTFCFVTDELKADWLSYVRQGICDYLTDRGLAGSVDKNDILIDGKKISGSSVAVQYGMRIESMFVAVVSSKELVENICLKERIKTPGSLEENGVTADEIKELVIDLTRRYIDGAEDRRIQRPSQAPTLRDIMGGNKTAVTAKEFKEKLSGNRVGVQIMPQEPILTVHDQALDSAILRSEDNG